MHSLSLIAEKGGGFFLTKCRILNDLLLLLFKLLVNHYKVLSIKFFFFAVITCHYLSLQNLFRLKTLSHKGVLVPVFVLARPRDKLGRAKLSLFL